MTDQVYIVTTVTENGKATITPTVSTAKGARLHLYMKAETLGSQGYSIEFNKQLTALKARKGSTTIEIEVG